MRGHWYLFQLHPWLPLRSIHFPLLFVATTLLIHGLLRFGRFDASLGGTFSFSNACWSNMLQCHMQGTFKSMIIVQPLAYAKSSNRWVVCIVTQLMECLFHSCINPTNTKNQQAHDMFVVHNLPMLDTTN
jgi:hypothetical protein